MDHVRRHLGTHWVSGRAAVGGAVQWTMFEDISVHIGSVAEQQWAELCNGPCSKTSRYTLGQWQSSSGRSCAMDHVRRHLGTHWVSGRAAVGGAVQWTMFEDIS